MLLATKAPDRKHRRAIRPAFVEHWGGVLRAHGDIESPRGSTKTRVLQRRLELCLIQLLIHTGMDSVIERVISFLWKFSLQHFEPAFCVPVLILSQDQHPLQESLYRSPSDRSRG